MTRHLRTPPAVRERKREQMARRRAANPEAHREYQRELYAANREGRRAKLREYSARRFFWSRAMKLKGPDRATARDLAALWRAQRGRCWLTGRKLDRTAQIDHLTPKCRGGTDAPSNLRWLCASANIAKRHLTEQEFIALCRDVMRYLLKRITDTDASDA